MPRFYLPEELIIGSFKKLPENIVRHIQVLRLKTGDHFTLFNGNNGEYLARLSNLDRRFAECEILSQVITDNESPLSITLVQAISSGERMDFTLQKSVELGVTTIQPILSERCIVRLSGERADKRRQRWQEIVISACEQSGRSIVPQVLPIIEFSDYLSTIKEDELHLLMSLNQAKKLTQITPIPDALTFMVGPEGGWTDKEEEQAFIAGFQAISLGKRILRTETASLAAIAAMQILWGDFA